MKVVIAYHSFTGKTRALAEAAAEGARSAGADVLVKEVAEATADDLAGVGAFLIATPQTFDSIAGETKKLLERVWAEKEKVGPDIAFAGIVCHVTDPAATVDLLHKVSGYFGFSEVGEALTVPADALEAGREHSRQLGASLATAS